jgi:hypothetical protein
VRGIAFLLWQIMKYVKVLTDMCSTLVTCMQGGVRESVLLIQDIIMELDALERYSRTEERSDSGEQG